MSNWPKAIYSNQRLIKLHPGLNFFYQMCKTPFQTQQQVNSCIKNGHFVVVVGSYRCDR